MTVLPLVNPGNSAKFTVTHKNGDFVLAISYTLRNKIWRLTDDTTAQLAAQELAEAIVSRHNPELPFKALYVFAEHNTKSTLADTVQYIRKMGF